MSASENTEGAKCRAADPNCSVSLLSGILDKRRKYNPVNGVENIYNRRKTMVDRPWSNREYLRVDWSNNLAKDVRCNAWVAFFDCNSRISQWQS